MKRWLGLLVLIAAVPMLQGAVAPFLPTAARPDLSLLVVLSLALCWRSTAGGLVLAAFSGFVADLFSGALLGQHALLRILVFAAARVLSLRMNLGGVFPQMLFAGIVTVVHALGIAGLTAFFHPGAGLGLLSPGALMLHALANALVAPLVTVALSALVARLGAEEAGRRLLRLEPRSRLA